MNDPVEPGLGLVDLEKRLSTALLKLGRINRDLERDRILRDKPRLLKERSDINMLLLLFEAQRREAASDGALPKSEIDELMESRGGAALDDKEVARLRARRVEIANMLREVDHAGTEGGPHDRGGERGLLGQERLGELQRERSELAEQALEVLRTPAYFAARCRKLRRKVAQGKAAKAVRYVGLLAERLGPNPVADAFDVILRLHLEERELAFDEVLALARRASAGVVLQALLDDVHRLEQRFPDVWREAIAEVLGNVALFRGLAYEERSDFWSGDELRRELDWQRLAVQNPSAPAELLGTLLGCPPEELARDRRLAIERYASERALDVMTEVLRTARDPELVSRILDLVEDDPVVRVRFYHVARRHDGLPAALARRILQHGDCSLEESLDFRRRNPAVPASAATATGGEA